MNHLIVVQSFGIARKGDIKLVSNEVLKRLTQECISGLSSKENWLVITDRQVVFPEEEIPDEWVVLPGDYHRSTFQIFVEAKLAPKIFGMSPPFEVIIICAPQHWVRCCTDARKFFPRSRIISMDVDLIKEGWLRRAAQDPRVFYSFSSTQWWTKSPVFWWTREIPLILMAKFFPRLYRRIVG